jgi:hypothetical protein
MGFVHTSNLGEFIVKITRELAQQAFDMVKPAIIAMMGCGMTKRKQLAIVIKGLDGTTEMFEYIGDFDSFEGPYGEIARSKAQVAFETKMSTIDLQRFPHLMIPGKTHWTGGVFCQGFSVGVSGVQAHYDHLFANWIAEAILALFRDSFARFRTEQPSENFLPQE